MGFEFCDKCKEYKRIDSSFCGECSPLNTLPAIEVVEDLLDWIVSELAGPMEDKAGLGYERYVKPHNELRKSIDSADAFLKKHKPA